MKRRSFFAFIASLFAGRRIAQSFGVASPDSPLAERPRPEIKITLGSDHQPAVSCSDGDLVIYFRLLRRTEGKNGFYSYEYVSEPMQFPAHPIAKAVV